MHVLYPREECRNVLDIFPLLFESLGGKAKPWPKCLWVSRTRARQLSEEGFGITERIHRDWSQSVNGLRSDPDSQSQLLVNNNVPPLYSISKNPNLAKAFRELQLYGRDAFYKGATANAIVNKIQSLGGVMTLDDLAQYQSLWVEPISTKSCYPRAKVVITRDANRYDFAYDRVRPPVRLWAVITDAIIDSIHQRRNLRGQSDRT